MAKARAKTRRPDPRTGRNAHAAKQSCGHRVRGVFAGGMVHYAAFFQPSGASMRSSDRRHDDTPGGLAQDVGRCKTRIGHRCRFRTGWRWWTGVAAILVAVSAFGADPSKLLRIAFPVAETGFDPVRVSDLYSNTVNEAIFERLLTYDYLARPAKIVPLTAEALPEISDGGRTYLLHLRRGIYFTPDPAFKGQPREL